MSETFDKETLMDKAVLALRLCYDPEIPVNIYDLGLIYEINVDKPGHIDITMTLTSPMCPVAETLPPQVQKAVKAMTKVEEVQVHLVWDPPWTQDRMNEEARLELGWL
jgi:FeS assembly SUF system protein